MKTAVVGVGNILMRDDGVGVYVVRQIEENGTAENVTCIDGGTAAFEALDAAEGCERIIVVDAVKAGGKPGTLYRLTFDEWHVSRGASLHDVQFMDAIAITELLEQRNIDVAVVGIEPEEISLGLELSEAVKGRFQDLVNAVLEEIERGTP